MNLENAPATLQESAASASPLVNAVMGGGERPRHAVEGMLQRHLLSTGMAAFPANADGVPFDCSHVYASGNLAADMYANIAAESTGRLLAVRLFNAAHDDGMRDMLSFLIARDTMHQQQWLAVIEELGGSKALPIPNSFDQSQEKQEFSYVFLGTDANAEPPPAGRFNRGPSMDGKGKFTASQNRPLGEEPVLGPARKDSGAQSEQMG
jgi:Mn-containing catalase